MNYLSKLCIYPFCESFLLNILPFICQRKEKHFIRIIQQNNAILLINVSVLIYCKLLIILQAQAENLFGSII